MTTETWIDMKTEQPRPGQRFLGVTASGVVDVMIIIPRKNSMTLRVNGYPSSIKVEAIRAWMPLPKVPAWATVREEPAKKYKEWKDGPTAAFNEKASPCAWR